MSLRDRVKEQTGKRRFLNVPIPELGTVRFRSIFAGERIAIEQVAMREGKSASVLGLMATLCDEDSESTCYTLRFTRKDGEYKVAYDDAEYEQLADLDGKVFEAMIDAMNAHCTSDVTFDEMIENAKKNCETTPSESTSTESRQFAEST